jgi:putative FmdB family regulatory protein
MPTYDYTCTKCGHEWEVFQSMKDAPLKSCPDCKKRSAKRLVGGGAGLIFKGTGFYITDYKNKPAPGSDAKSASKPGTNKTPAAASKSDSKT